MSDEVDIPLVDLPDSVWEDLLDKAFSGQAILDNESLVPEDVGTVGSEEPDLTDWDDLDTDIEEEPGDEIDHVGIDDIELDSQPGETEVIDWSETGETEQSAETVDFESWFDSEFDI